MRPAVATKVHSRMYPKIVWVVLIYLSCACNGESLSAKGSDTTKVERIVFRPRAKVDFHDANKEMLRGSVIWFKPKGGQEADETGKSEKDVIRLTNRKITTYRRQPKTLDLTDESTENMNKKEQNIHKEVSVTPRASKSISQGEEINGNTATKEMTKNIQNTDRKINQNGRRKNAGSKNRRKNNGQKRGRNKNKKQKIQQNPNINSNSTTPNSNETVPTQKKTANKQNVQEEIKEASKTFLLDLLSKDEEIKSNAKVNDTNTNITESPRSSDNREIAQKVKAKIVEPVKAKVVEEIEEITNGEKRKEKINTKPPKIPEQINEGSTLANHDKQKIVENADLLGMLLAQSDPALVKVLIDNSSPENLNVFLSHSNITLEELKDIVAY